VTKSYQCAPLRDLPRVGQRTPAQVTTSATARLAWLRRSHALGAVGVLVALWCWVGLPGLHVLEHAREEAQPPQIVYGRNGIPHSARLQALIDELLYGRDERARPHPHEGEHRHSHDRQSPDGRRHGGGSLQHFALAFAASPSFLLPPVVGVMATLPVALPATQPKPPAAWCLRPPRGPPPSALST
jgi:hypothetical protein